MVRVVVYCGITFATSVILAAPYLAHPPGERVLGLYGSDVDISRGSENVAYRFRQPASSAQGEQGVSRLMQAPAAHHLGVTLAKPIGR